MKKTNLPLFTLSLLLAGMLSTAPAADALRTAAINGDVAEVQRLLDAGADVNVKAPTDSTLHITAGGETPFMDSAAAATSLRDAVEQFAPNAEEKAKFSRQRKDSFRIMELLLKKGADINAKDQKGESALHHAVYSEDNELVKWLLDKGADANLKDKKGKSLFHWVANSNKVELTKLFISKGADVNAAEPEQKPLLIQVAQKMEESKDRIAGYRKNKNFDLIPNMQRQYDDALKIARILLEGGADPDGKSRGTPPPRDAEYMNAVQKIKAALKEQK